MTSPGEFQFIYLSDLAVNKDSADKRVNGTGGQSWTSIL